MTLLARSHPRDLSAVLLRVDGWFVGLVGLVQVGFELLSHYWGAGPLAGRFHGAPYTIGFVEAHGLAAVLGVLLVRAARGGDRRFWHLLAAAVHLLLGVANALFWESFVTFDLVGPGVVATAAHALFVAGHWACATGNRPSRGHVRNVLLLRPVLVVTFATGLVLHGLALAFGRPWLLAHVLTPAVDSALVVPMAYAAAAGWVLRRRVVHPSAGHRRVYLAMVGYLAISVPVHLDSLLAWEVRYVSAFPQWYSLVVLPAQALLLLFAWRLRFAERPARIPAGRQSQPPVAQGAQ